MSIEIVSKETTSKVADWMINNPNGNSFESLKDTFKPILEFLIENCSWAVTGIKTGNKKIFFPKLNPSLEQNEALSKLVQTLGDKGEIITTTDVCNKLHKQNSFLMIFNKHEDSEIESLKNDVDRIWIVSAKNFVKSIKEEFSILSLNVRDLLDKDKELSAIHQLIQKLSEMPCLEVFCSNRKTFDLQLSEQLSSKKFKLYILILTILEESWTRISMLPTISPMTHLHHPGGIVLCEHEKESLRNLNELKEIRDICSIPFWPWMLTARTTERGDGSNLSLKLKDFLSAMSNDYRTIEFLFGGNFYTLLNKGYFERPRKSGTVFKVKNNKDDVKRMLGLYEFENYFKGILKRVSDKKFVFKKDKKGKMNLKPALCESELNSILSEISTVDNQSLKPYFLKDDNNQSTVIEWEQERNQKISNLKMSYEESSICKISIIIPILPSDERLNNFLLCLKSIDQQTGLILFPDCFELIVLIDGNNENKIDQRKTAAERIGECIRKFKYLKYYKVFYSIHENSIGRSSIRNFGIHKAMGNVIQLFDDSMLLHRDYLLEILLRFEHLKGQKIAITGFRQRVNYDDRAISALQQVTAKGLIIPDVLDDYKRNEKVLEPFSFAFNSFQVGDKVDYMELTGDLCFLTGNQILGTRTLNQFFNTGLVAFLKSELIASGGFHKRFNEDWGMEDGHMGVLFLANGNKIIPCYSALAFDLHHKKAKAKSDHKSGRRKPNNLFVFEELNSKPMSYYNARLFERDVKRVSELFEKFEENVSPKESI